MKIISNKFSIINPFGILETGTQAKVNADPFGQLDYVVSRIIRADSNSGLFDSPLPLEVTVKNDVSAFKSEGLSSSTPLRTPSTILDNSSLIGHSMQLNSTAITQNNVTNATKENLITSIRQSVSNSKEFSVCDKKEVEEDCHKEETLNLMPFVWIEGKRKNVQLVHVPEESQLYRKQKCSKDFTYCGCYIQNCCASLKIKNGTLSCLHDSQNEHNHGPQDELIKEFLTLAEFRKGSLIPAKLKKLNDLEKNPEEKVFLQRMERNRRIERRNARNSMEPTMTRKRKCNS